MSIQVQHDETGRRFLTEVEGHQVYVEYALVDDDTVDFQRTFTPPELRGRGLAREVVREAVAWARSESKEIVASCWFVRKFLDREEESTK